MTNQQKRFCDEYLISLNATQAAIKAGYAEKYAGQNAGKLMKNPNIKKYIEERLAEKDDELIAKQDEILQYLTAVMRKTTKSSVLARDEIGADVVIEKLPDEKEATKAAELLGKRYGLWVEKVENDVDMELNITVDYGEDNE